MGGESTGSSQGGAERPVRSLLVAYAAMLNVLTRNAGNLDLMLGGEIVPNVVHDDGKRWF